MEERNYSMDIAEAMNDFLLEDGWHFNFEEEKGFFIFSLSITGKIKKVDYVISIKNDGYIVYAISPIGADKEDRKMMLKMADFVARANYGLKYGNFELDMDDGEIRFKFPVSCDDFIPTVELIRRSVYTPAQMFGRYSSGITEMIFGRMTPAEAIDMCENPDKSRLDRLLSTLQKGIEINQDECGSYDSDDDDDSDEE